MISGCANWSPRAFLVFCVILLAISFTCGCSERPRELGNAAPAHRLVILVPGTFANQPDWARTDVAGKTLAKELLQQLNPGDTVIPYWWSGGLSHLDRVAAAGKLAKLINDTRLPDDDVYLVGHSHGGNVCLLAAAQSEQPVAAIICMGTPHVYLHHSNGNCDTAELPVYCLPQTLKNAEKIVCISDKNDRVAEELSNAFLTGTSEAEAADAVIEWQAISELNLSETRRSVLNERLFESGRLFASRKLNLADENFELHSDHGRILGISAHTRLRSPEMACWIAALVKVIPDSTSHP